MTGGIVLLGWGSLLWDGGAEFEAAHTAWLFDGPSLKIEFSRISSSRAGALTLVIDPENGAPTTVAYCLSRRSTIADAIEDLRRRERTGAENIGFLDGARMSRSRDAASTLSILAWAEKRELSGAVWTDLPTNFQARTGERISIDAARRYLQSLDEQGRAKAREYARRAPLFVQTPLREEIANIA